MERHPDLPIGTPTIHALLFPAEENLVVHQVYSAGKGVFERRPINAND